MFPHLQGLALASLVLAQLAGCGSGEADDRPGGGVPAGACPDASIGGFVAELREGFTAVQGQVYDSVHPMNEAVEVASAGACTLQRPPTLFCDPACAGETTCDASGSCVPSPVAISVGTVTIAGLQGSVEMTARAPVNFYNNTSALDHPGFTEGADIALSASGEGDVSGFDLDSVGVTQLGGLPASVTMESGTAVTLQWSEPSSADYATVHIDLNIAQHGGTPGWITCETDDNGSFEIPVELTDALLEQGYSGFPTVSVTRRSVDSVSTELGCIEFSVQSAVTLPIEIPGLTSCSDNDDCQAPETCQPDLTCG